jgi:hypothetical protein
MKKTITVSIPRVQWFTRDGYLGIPAANERYIVNSSFIPAEREEPL